MRKAGKWKIDGERGSTNSAALIIVPKNKVKRSMYNSEVYQYPQLRVECDGSSTIPVAVDTTLFPYEHTATTQS